jgi:hypothetical protein
MYPICTHSLTISEIQEISQWPNAKNNNHLALSRDTEDPQKATLNQAVRGSNPWWRTEKMNEDKGLPRGGPFVVFGASLDHTLIVR